MRFINTGIVVLMLYSLLSCDTASTVDPIFDDYFIKYYGTEGEQTGVDLVINDDGTMILLGNTISPPPNITSPFIVKVDVQGNVIWQRKCGGDNESAADIELIKKGPYAGNVIVATNTGTDRKIRLTRIAQENGQGIDSVVLSSGVGQVVKSITPLETGSGYLITGYADGNFTPDPQLTVPPPDESDLLALRIDESLQQVDYVLSQGGEHIGWSVKGFEAILNDSLKFLVFGYSDRTVTTSTYEPNFEVLVPTPSGIPVFRFVAGNSSEQQIASSVIRTPVASGEGYLMVGSSRDNSNNSDIYLAKFNKTLDAKSLDQKIPLGIKLEGIAAANAEPDGYFILANQIDDNDKRNIYLLRLGINGNPVWSKSFGRGEGDDTAGSVNVLSDGRVAVIGTMELETERKMALIVLSPEGDLSK
jgi:hypothetical protein